MQPVIFKNLGLIDFKQSWDYQEELLSQIVKQKMLPGYHAQKEKSIAGAVTPNYLLLCEHPHVYTLGKSGKQDHLLINEEQLSTNAVAFYKINRGGDITYHGPGQLVGYPILNLDYFFNDIHFYLRCLEEIIILTLAEYGITGSRIEKLTGVWLDANDEAKARKICAFGVRCSRWVTMHGFALNVNANLDYFNNIVPCGIADKAVTSMQKELGRDVPMEEVTEKIKRNFEKVFAAILTDEVKEKLPS
jgi:lipoyl(octanoyl) transferase